MKLINLKSLAPKGMNHPNLTETLLRDCEQIAFAFVDIGGLISYPNSVKANRPDDWR